MKKEQPSVNYYPRKYMYGKLVLNHLKFPIMFYFLPRKGRTFVGIFVFKMKFVMNPNLEKKSPSLSFFVPSDILSDDEIFM